MLDEDTRHLCVWVKLGNDAMIDVTGKKDIKELLRVKPRRGEIHDKELVACE